MCGVLSVFRYRSSIDKEQCIKALQCMDHRGPDADSFFMSDRVFLGHKRLSIVDLSDAATQPFFDATKTRCIIFNGEIYNHDLLREQLKEKYSFSTHSDTEVLLYALIDKGVEALQELNGMWSFIFLDTNTGECIVSRDRFGVKPLFYAYTDEQLIFSSEIKSILALLGDVQPNYHAVWDFLNLGYQDQDHSTFFQDVYRFPQGHVFVYNIHHAPVEPFSFVQYYTLPDVPKKQLSDAEAVDGFAALLQSAVELRVPREVKYGISLSGGLDSSAIAYHVRNTDIETVSISYPQSGYTEAEGVAEIAQCLGIVNHIITPPEDVVFVDTVRDILWYLEEPSSHYSIFSQWFVMKKIHEQGCKVVFGGQGADEYLAGYYSFYPAKVLSLLRDVWRGMTNISSMLRELKFMNSYVGGHLLLKTVKYYMRTAIATRHLRIKWSSLAQPQWRNYQRALPKSTVLPLHRPSFDPLDVVLSQSFFANSLPSLLRDEDKIAMRYSIENRVPFLDYRLVEYVFSLPHIFKIRDGWSKWILRSTMNDKLSNSIVWNKEKKGYPTPVHAYMLREFQTIADLLLSPTSFCLTLFKKPELESWLAQAQTQRLVTQERDLWRLLQLELWYAHFFVRR